MPKLAKCPREAISHVPREIAVKVLSNPKQKLSGKQRRAFQKALSNRVLPPSCPPKSTEQKLDSYLEKLSLVQLVRQQRRLSAYVINGEKLVQELPHDGIARRMVEDDLRFWCMKLALVNDFVLRRLTAPAHRDATPHKKRKQNAS